jgi:hypothetical protein
MLPRVAYDFRCCGLKPPRAHKNFANGRNHQKFARRIDSSTLSGALQSGLGKSSARSRFAYSPQAMTQRLGGNSVWGPNGIAGGFSETKAMSFSRDRCVAAAELAEDILRGKAPWPN